MIEQKLDYVHNNPVVERIVNEAKDYVYSSAMSYSGARGLLDVDFLD